MQILPASGDSLFGVVREVIHGRLSYFEFLRFQATGSVVEMHPYPRGVADGVYLLDDGPNLTFREVGGERVTTWLLADAGRTLHATVTRRKDGREVKDAWTFSRGPDNGVDV